MESIEAIEKFQTLLARMNAYYAEYARLKGTTASAQRILHCIVAQQETGCTQRTLCDATVYPKQTINHTVTEFLNKGYIEMTVSDTDRRSKIIKLTPAGSAFAEELEPDLTQALIKSMDKLTAKEKDTVINLMTRYADQCGKRIEVLK